VYVFVCAESTIYTSMVLPNRLEGIKYLFFL